MGRRTLRQRRNSRTTGFVLLREQLTTLRQGWATEHPSTQPYYISQTALTPGLHCETKRAYFCQDNNDYSSFLWVLNAENNWIMKVSYNFVSNICFHMSKNYFNNNSDALFVVGFFHISVRYWNNVDATLKMFSNLCIFSC